MRAELAPAPSRAFALTTGTIGLVAIAVLVLAVSPSRQQQPFAVSATTAPAILGPVEESSSRVTVASVRRTEPSATVSSPADDHVAAVLALATPLGSGRYALVSLAALNASTTTLLDVVLPSGRTTVGRVVERSDESALIQLSDSEPGHDIAERRPHDLDMVTVMSQPPIKVTFAEVASLEVGEGTPVIDSAGDLIGLCTGSGDGKRTRLIAVDTSMSMLDEALEPDPSEDRPGTTAPMTTTTVVVTTTVVPTVAVTTTVATSTSTTSTTSTTTTVPDEEPPPRPTDN